MAASFNRVILLGNLTRDPQVRYIPSGQAVAEIGIAVTHSWFDKQANQRKEETTFVDVTLWGRTAEVAGEYLAKGRQVLVEGRLKLDTWDDKETGQKRSKLRVVGEYMQMVGNRGDAPGGGPGGSAGAQRGAVQGRSQAPPQQYDSDPGGAADRSPADSFYDEAPSSAGPPPADEVPF